ncbi:MAG: YceI family protein [Ferruginibacter sp.]|nr:YceI family protein [Ferruginibacter sp.]
MTNTIHTIGLLTVLLFMSARVSAQKIYTKNGRIAFYSKTPLEDISADNNQVMSVINTQTGEVQFSVLVKNFRFKKALMEEHFNDSYLESGKYSKASFKGLIKDIAKVNFKVDGSYLVSVSGDLTIHGITKPVTAPCTLTITGDKTAGSAKFFVRPTDYNISIPKVVRDNIAETIEVTVNCNYDQQL